MSVVLKSFPFDSMDVLNPDTNQYEGDRQYAAAIFAGYFKKFLSNGVYYGNYKNYGENSMKVSLNSGLTITVHAGCGIIEGVDYELENNTNIVLERPASGSRVDRIVVKMDSTLSVRNTQLYVKQGNGTTPAALTRNSNIYEICIAEVTISSSSNLTNNSIVDKRNNSTLCGIVNSLISVDGEELYQSFQAYIDSVTDNLVRKDQPSVVLTGTLTDRNGGTSKNNFTDGYKNKLDGIDEGATNVTVEDNLTSTSTENALSANQGKVLKGLVDGKQKTITSGTSSPSGGSNGDMYAQYF